MTVFGLTGGVLVGIALVQGVISLIEGFSALKHFRDFRPRSTWLPRTVVFCPCKGVDAEFDANIQSILRQRYRDLRVVFVVESTEDAAYAALVRMGGTVLVAGEASSRSQKVHNLLYAVEHASADAEVFVFCDADARFPENWVVNLLAPLVDQSVGVSTGYRWYVPGLRLASRVRSIWNASIVTMLGSHSRNFAWGGSMALRRDAFERMAVLSAWEHAVSDDYAVTNAARKAGLRIVFVPECLVPSYGECSWRELFEFTTRQILITRVYEPRIWRVGFLGQTIFCTAFWGLLLSVPAGMPAQSAFAAIYVLAMAKAWVRLKAVNQVLPHGSLSKDRWSYILSTPLISLLYEYNMIRSALSRDIVWRQIHYRLVSPHHTVVRRGAGGSSIP